jgi:hypothetical protein
VGNHGTHLWRQYGVNEVNIFENGFLDEFNIALENLRIARNANPASNNFGNAGLPGQMAIPIIATALGTTNDITFATTIARGEAGRLAANIASNVTRMNRLISANLIPFATFQDPNNPANPLKLSNYFVVNPLAALSTALPTSGNSFIMDNGAGNTYNALQIDLRRRMSNGLLVQGSYVWSKSLTNFFANDSAVFSQPTGPCPKSPHEAQHLELTYKALPQLIDFLGKANRRRLEISSTTKAHRLLTSVTHSRSIGYTSFRSGRDADQAGRAWQSHIPVWTDDGKV